MTWGGGQGGPPTGIGGRDRANFARIEASHEDMLRESQELGNRNDYDEDPEDQQKHDGVGGLRYVGALILVLVIMSIVVILVVVGAGTGTFRAGMAVIAIVAAIFGVIIWRSWRAAVRWDVREPASEEESLPDSQEPPTPQVRGRSRFPHGEDYYREVERMSEEEEDFEGESGPKED